MAHSPIDLVLAALDQRNKKYREVKPGVYQASSPLREDANHSLSITVKPNGTILMHDFGGGQLKDVLACLGLAMSDLYPPQPAKTMNISKPDTIYSYRDENGMEVAQVLRFSFTDKDGIPAKTFRQRYVGPNNKWVWKVPPNMPLYRLPELMAADKDLYVWIVEGEKDVDNLYQAGLVATTNNSGSSKDWPESYYKLLQGRSLVVCGDNDQAGLTRAMKLATDLTPYAKIVKLVLPKDIGVDHIPKGDISDALELSYVNGYNLSLLANGLPAFVPPPPPAIRRIVFERDALLSASFPTPTWLVKDLIPEQSLAILAGRPKIGKSWLVLQMANSIADGAKFLGRETTQGKVLYIALEDNPRRIQGRLKTQAVHSWEGVTFYFAWPDLMEDGIERLGEVITQGGYSLAVIDTISRAVALNPDDSKGLIQVQSSLQNLAFETMATILCIDHHRKLFAGVDDVIDAVVDATAKTAIADLILGLFRPQREKFGQLKATGRDIDEVDLALQFLGNIGTWEYLGPTEQVAMSNAEVKIMDAINDLGTEASASKIVAHTQMAQGYIYQVLREMMGAGKIEKKSHGAPYSIPGPTPPLGQGSLL